MPNPRCALLYRSARCHSKEQSTWNGPQVLHTGNAGSRIAQISVDSCVHWLIIWYSSQNRREWDPHPLQQWQNTLKVSDCGCAVKQLPGWSYCSAWSCQTSQRRNTTPVPQGDRPMNPCSLWAGRNEETDRLWQRTRAAQLGNLLWRGQNSDQAGLFVCLFFKLEVDANT